MKLQIRRCAVVLAFTVSLAAGVLITSCGDATGTASSTIPTPARATIPAVSESDNTGSSSNDGLKRSSQAGNVTVEITWEKGDAPAGGPLQFKVVMDTHSVDLDGVDLAKLAVLRNDSGKEVSPERWEAPAGGHHRSGTIVFPATAGGNALIGPQTKSIELIVRDVAGIKQRSFRWEVTS